MSAPAIVIVATHFGPAPAWFPAFLWSCRGNPDVQWRIYADFDVTFTVPGNVTITRLDLREFSRRASDVFGMRIDIDRASVRKACDLKPAYGLLFADDLRGFDWWACTDLDIIWGNVRRYMTDDLLDQHDIVSSRRHKLSGHFTMFRNTDTFNRTFELVPNIRALLSMATCQRVDEHALTHALRERIDAAPVEERPRVYWRDELTINTKYQKALPAGDGGNLLWTEGRTFDASGREFMYLHFHKLKASMRTFEMAYEDTPEMLVINGRGIFARLESYVAAY